MQPAVCNSCWEARFWLHVDEIRRRTSLKEYSWSMGSVSLKPGKKIKIGKKTNVSALQYVSGGKCMIGGLSDNQ